MSKTSSYSPYCDFILLQLTCLYLKMSMKMEVDQPKLEPPVDKVVRRIVESKVK